MTFAEKLRIIKSGQIIRQLRMLGYLYRTSNPRAEDVVDEMLAIFSDRDAVMQKKELEHAQATINQIYRDGL